MIQLREQPMVRTHLPSPATEKPELSRLEIDLSRLEGNLRALRAVVQRRPGAGDAPGTGMAAARGSTGGDAKSQAATGRGVRICAVVKKNAYGLGAAPVAARLIRAGVDMLAVYSADEAEQLIKQAVDAPLLLLMPVRQLARTDLLYRHAVAGKLHLSVHEPGQLEAINQIGRTFGIRMPVHLYLDTGMSRAGLADHELQATLKCLRRATHVQLAGLHTHLATADVDVAFAHEQLARFQQAVSAVDPDLRSTALLHMANTFATLRDPAFHLDMVRPGLGLLGVGPELLEGEPRLADMPELRPVMRWVSRVIHVQRYPVDTPVGYGSTHRLARESTLGVIPVGYGDGYPLALSNRSVVRIRPQSDDLTQPWIEAPVLGRVNMDQLVIDLTDAAGNAGLPAGAASPESLLDAEAELISDDPDAPNALPKLAALAGSHCYEMLCRLGAALPRKYRQ